MPVVKKQTPKVSLNPGASVLDRIQPVHLGDGGIKLCVYGRGKTGKTRLSCTFPKPVLLIGTEDGTKSVAKVPGVDFVRVYKSEEVDTLATMLAGGKYKTAILDTAGGLQDLILKEILGLEDVPVQKSWGLAQQQQWQICGAQLKERLRQLLDLADKKGLNVVCIAHERSFNDDNNSDAIFPTVGAALTPSAAGWLNAACDYVCQTFLRAETAVRKNKIGDKVVETLTKTGKIEYCLRVGPHETYMTGFRLPQGSNDLPDALVDPSYDKIAKLIRGE